MHYVSVTITWFYWATFFKKDKSEIEKQIPRRLLATYIELFHSMKMIFLAFRLHSVIQVGHFQGKWIGPPNSNYSVIQVSDIPKYTSYYDTERTKK